MEFFSPEWWVALGQIMMINIVLSGDNAVVIALASRNLPPNLQKKAIFWGSAAAIILRIILTFFAVALLSMSYIKLAGAVLLLWIGVKLLVPEEGHGDLEGASNIMGAVKTILIADFVMSLDNVIAVAAAAKDDIWLLVIGLGVSIPLIIFGSALLLKVMDRFPIIITIGAALLGWVAGDMAVHDGAIKDWVLTVPWLVHYKVAPIVGAIFVVIVGKWLAARQEKAAKH